MGSCGICKGSCKDTHNDCPGWASDGECVSNPGHVLKSCPNSCSVCKEGATCADKNATACAIWALNDECLKNPDHMHTECAETFSVQHFAGRAASCNHTSV